MIGIIPSMPVTGSAKDAEKLSEYPIGLRKNSYESNRIDDWRLG